MKTETVEIVTSKEKFFLEYLTLKKPIINAILTKINRKKTTLSDRPMISMGIYPFGWVKEKHKHTGAVSVFSIL